MITMDRAQSLATSATRSGRLAESFARRAAEPSCRVSVWMRGMHTCDARGLAELAPIDCYHSRCRGRWRPSARYGRFELTNSTCSKTFILTADYAFGT